MPYFFQDPEAVITTFQRWQDRKNQINATVDGISPEQAVNIARLSRMFPFMSPGVVRSLGQSGLNSDSPVTQFAVMQEMLKNYSTVGDWSGQLGKVQRTPQFGTPSKPKSGPLEKRGRMADSVESTALTPANSDYQMAGRMERAKELLKDGETLGVFNPTTQLLVEPDFGDGDRPSRAYKVFSQLQNVIYSMSRSPVPYLSRDGYIRGFSPATAEIGDPRLDPNTGEALQGPMEGRIDTEGMKYSPEAAAHLSSLPENQGVSFPTSSGDRRTQLTQQTEAYKQSSSDIIAQIFAESERNPNTDKTVNAGFMNFKGGPIDPGMLRQVSQDVGVVLNAPIQETQGLVRNLYGAAHHKGVDWTESQSDLGVLFPALVRGAKTGDTRDSYMGNGFFVDPESAVARERRAREAERGLIGNHSVTIGRILANTVFEPDTKPFMIVSGAVDAAAQIYADPSAHLLSSASKIEEASKTFSAGDEALESAGIFRGLRPKYHQPTFETWATKNTEVIRAFKDAPTAYDVHKLTKGQLPLEVEKALAFAKDERMVRQVLDTSIDRGRILKTTQLESGRIQRVKRNWEEAHRVLDPQWSPRTTRFTKMMPHPKFDLDDPTGTANNLERLMQNAHAREEDIRDVYNYAAGTQTRNGLNQAIDEALSRQGGILQSYGIEDTVASFLTRTNRDTYAEDVAALRAQIGMDAPKFDVMAMDGAPLSILDPHLPFEHIGRYRYVPDQRVVRRLTTKFNFLTAKQTDIPVLTPLKIKAGGEVVRDSRVVGQARWPVALSDWVMSEFLKPLWLMRLAWPIRVIGEEQLRIAGDGLASATKDPMHWIAIVIGGEQNRMTKMLDKLTPGLNPKLEISPNGAAFAEAEEMGKVVYKSHVDWLDSPVARGDLHYTTFDKNVVHQVDDWRRSWSHELSLLHYDPVSNFVANHSMPEAVDWFTNGPGTKYLHELQEAHPGFFDNPNAAPYYLETVSNRIAFATSNHPDLIDMVKTGKFSKYKGDKETVSNLFQDAPRINPEFTKHLRNYHDIGPDKIVGSTADSTHIGQDFMDLKRRATDRFFSALMGTPTSVLSRAPAFKQYVWRRAAELMPFASPEARATILANAEKAGLNKRAMKQLENAALRGKKDADGAFKGVLTADDIDMLAKGYAIEDTKTLLYDLSERSQVTDIMRIMVPFGEAWKEVITRWAKLATIEGPMGIPFPGVPVRRFQQVVTGARGVDFGQVMGAGQDPLTGKDRGFFYENEFGEEVFTYPGSEWATAAFSGVPVPLTGRVQGLNMFGNILPGLGPVAQIPIAWYLQDKPEYEFWREQLLPFGAPGSEETEDIFQLREYMPAWAKTAIDWMTDGSDNRVYASSVMYAATYLYSTGEYGDTVDEQQRLLADAKDAARDLYVVRGFGQFMLPSSPSIDWMVEDESGRLLNTRILAQEFQEMQTEDYDTAVDKFLDKYGPNSIGVMVPHNRSIVSASPVTLEAAQWASKHPGIRGKYDLVYGFFAPQGGEFHYPTFVRSFTNGERETVTPREWMNMKDSLMGNYYYQKAKGMLGEDANSPNEAQQQWLREQKKNIREAYPNWGKTVGLAIQGTDEENFNIMITQLYDASKNRTIRSTDAGKGLIEYLRYRDKAIDQAENLGHVSFKTANDMGPTRQWLTDHAYDIISKHPDFQLLWEIVFSREMEDAVEEPRKAA